MWPFVVLRPVDYLNRDEVVRSARFVEPMPSYHLISRSAD
jgi:hypothetical protein